MMINRLPMTSLNNREYLKESGMRAKVATA